MESYSPKRKKITITCSIRLASLSAEWTTSKNSTLIRKSSSTTTAIVSTRDSKIQTSRRWKRWNLHWSMSQTSIHSFRSLEGALSQLKTASTNVSSIHSFALSKFSAGDIQISHFQVSNLNRQSSKWTTCWISFRRLKWKRTNTTTELSRTSQTLPICMKSSKFNFKEIQSRKCGIASRPWSHSSYLSQIIANLRIWRRIRKLEASRSSTSKSRSRDLCTNPKLPDSQCHTSRQRG